MGLVRLICLASAARVMSLADDCLFKLPRFCDVLCSSSSPTVFNLSLLILSNFLRRFRSHTVNVPRTRLSSLFPLHSFPLLPKELSLRSSCAGINATGYTIMQIEPSPPQSSPPPPPTERKPSSKQTNNNKKLNQFCQWLSVSTQRPAGWGYKMSELKTSSCVDLDIDGSVRNTSRAQ